MPLGVEWRCERVVSVRGNDFINIYLRSLCREIYINCRVCRMVIKMGAY